MSRLFGDHDDSRDDRRADGPPPDSAPSDSALSGGTLRDRDDAATEMTLSEERMLVGTETERAGAVRARKHVDVENVSTRVQRGTEHADLDRVDVPDAEADSGEVETLPDGSLSIPVFEEQLVVTKRLVVRERVVVRKRTVYEEHEVSADLKRERLEVEADGDVVVDDEGRERR